MMCRRFRKMIRISKISIFTATIITRYRVRSLIMRKITLSKKIKIKQNRNYYKNRLSISPNRLINLRKNYNKKNLLIIKNDSWQCVRLMLTASFIIINRSLCIENKKKLNRITRSLMIRWMENRINK